MSDGTGQNGAASGEGNAPPVGADQGGAGNESGSPAPANWWDTDRFRPFNDWINAKGMATTDPLDALDKAIRVGQGAEKHLGKPADRLMARPGEGESLPDWMKSNAGMFGLPEAPEGYEIERPDLPEGVAWDDQLEAKVRQIAFDQGVPPGAVNALVGAYAERMADAVQAINAQGQEAEAELMAALERDWGTQTQAKIDGARAAMAAVAQAAGMDAEAIQSMALTLKGKAGDAGTIRMFAAIADMMGEDAMPGGGAPGGGQAAGGFATTPADARAQLARMNEPGSDWYEAVASGNTSKMQALMPGRKALERIAAGG